MRSYSCLLPCPVPKLNPYGMAQNAIIDNVPSIGDRKTPLATPQYQRSKTRVGLNQSKRTLNAFAHQIRGLEILLSDLGERCEISI
jgi:hypothetical protein